MVSGKSYQTITDDCGRGLRRTFGGSAKVYRRGTHRGVDPGETWERIIPRVKEFGITRVANITGLDRVGLPVVAVYRPNARSIVVSQGKGLDLAAARVSGLMESIESFFAERPALPLRLESFEELSKVCPIINLAGLPRVSAGLFLAHKPILWCEGRELMSGEQIWLPYEMVHTNFTLPLPQGSGCFLMSSNGLASGNHWLEAVCHGIAEVIERDALTLWNLRGGTGCEAGRLDPLSIDDPVCLEVINRLQDADLALGLWDITTDVGVACFACVLADRRPNGLGQFYFSQGSGCHVSREVALLRALTEAAQTRLTYIAGARDDAHRELFENARDPDRVARIRDEIDRVGARRFNEVPSRDFPDFGNDLAWLLDCLRLVGINHVAAVDLGGADLDIAVVRIVIPGLEGLHHAAGYVPGSRARQQRKGMGR